MYLLLNISLEFADIEKLPLGTRIKDMSPMQAELHVIVSVKIFQIFISVVTWVGRSQIPLAQLNLLIQITLLHADVMSDFFMYWEHMQAE